jgi:hypothetical protein
MAALEARDRADAFGQQVDDLALAFVAPLRAEDYYGLAPFVLARFNTSPSSQGRIFTR